MRINGHIDRNRGAATIAIADADVEAVVTTEICSRCISNSRAGTGATHAGAAVAGCGTCPGQGSAIHIGGADSRGVKSTGRAIFIHAHRQRSSLSNFRRIVLRINGHIDRNRGAATITIADADVEAVVTTEICSRCIGNSRARTDATHACASVAGCSTCPGQGSAIDIGSANGRSHESTGCAIFIHAHRQRSSLGDYRRIILRTNSHIDGNCVTATIAIAYRYLEAVNAIEIGIGNIADGRAGSGSTDNGSTISRHTATPAQRGAIDISSANRWGDKRSRRTVF